MSQMVFDDIEKAYDESLYMSNGLIDEYCWKLDSGMEDFIFYTMEELEEFVNANWMKEGE